MFLKLNIKCLRKPYKWSRTICSKERSELNGRQGEFYEMPYKPESGVWICILSAEGGDRAFFFLSHGYRDIIDSSVHDIFQARILEWVAIPSPADVPDSGIEPRSSTLQADSLPLS